MPNLHRSTYSSLTARNHHWDFLFRRDPSHEPTRVEAETVLPVQWVPQKTYTPEQKLMWAILDDAIRTALGTHFSAHINNGNRCDRWKKKKQQSLYDEAVAWIWSDDDAWPFSFLSICQHLDLEPGEVRRGLAGRRAA